MSVTKNMNLGNSDTIVNVTATGNIVGENIKSKGSATEPVYFDANGVAQVAIVKDSKTDTYSTATGDTNGRWTVTIPGITEYYDGLTIKIYLQKSYNSTFNTININGLGEKLMWLTRNNRLTTHYAQYSILALTYSASNAGSYNVSYTYCDPVNSANYRGNWVANTAYAIGDSVLNSGKYYICVVAHTSGTSINTTNFKASTTPYSSLALPGINNEIRDGFIVESARDTDTTTVLNHSSSSFKVSDDSNIRLSGYNLFGLDKNGNIIPFSLYQAGYTSYTSSINQNRVYQDQGFDFIKGIFYNNSSSGFNAGSNYNTTLSESQTGIEFRYTDNGVAASTANTLGLVMNKLVYFRGIIKEDGLFYLAPIEVTYNNKKYKRCWTQDIPTQKEYDSNNYQYVYWLIGCPYYNASYPSSLYQINLFITNTLYWYNNGKFEQYKDLCLDNGQALKWMHNSNTNFITPYSAITYTDSQDSDNSYTGNLCIGRTEMFNPSGSFVASDNILIGHESYGSNNSAKCYVTIHSSELSLNGTDNININGDTTFNNDITINKKSLSFINDANISQKLIDIDYSKLSGITAINIGAEAYDSTYNTHLQLGNDYLSGVSIKGNGINITAAGSSMTLDGANQITLKISQDTSSKIEITNSNGTTITGNASITGTLTVGTTNAKKNTYINGTILTSGGNIYIQNDNAALCLGKPKEMIGADGDRILFYDYKTLADGTNGTLRTLLCVKYDDSADKYVNYLGYYGYNNDVQIGVTGYTNNVYLNTKNAGRVHLNGGLNIGECSECMDILFGKSGSSLSDANKISLKYYGGGSFTQEVPFLKFYRDSKYHLILADAWENSDVTIGQHGGSTTTSDINLYATNTNINGNLILNGSSRGTKTLTTSNQTMGTFTCTKAAICGTVWLLTIRNKENGIGTYLISVGANGISINTLGYAAPSVSYTVTASSMNSTTKVCYIYAKASASISVDYAFTQLF